MYIPHVEDYSGGIPLGLTIGYFYVVELDLGFI